MIAAGAAPGRLALQALWTTVRRLGPVLALTAPGLALGVGLDLGWGAMHGAAEANAFGAASQTVHQAAHAFDPALGWLVDGLALGWAFGALAAGIRTQDGVDAPGGLQLDPAAGLRAIVKRPLTLAGLGCVLAAPAQLSFLVVEPLTELTIPLLNSGAPAILAVMGVQAALVAGHLYWMAWLGAAPALAALGLATGWSALGAAHRISAGARLRLALFGGLPLALAAMLWTWALILLINLFLADIRPALVDLSYLVFDLLRDSAWLALFGLWLGLVAQSEQHAIAAAFE